MLSPFRIARQKRTLTLADAGERVAEAIGDSDQAERLRRALTRAENGSAVRWTAEELSALRALYAVGDDDLDSPVYWSLFIDLGDHGQFVALANRLLLFSSPEAAYTARGVLSASGWLAGALAGVAGAVPVAFFASEIAKMLVENYGEGLPVRLQRAATAVDPDAGEVALLVLAENVMAHPEQPAREGAVEALQRAGAEGKIDDHFSLRDVRALQHRRVQRGDPADRQDNRRRERHLLEALMAVAKRELEADQRSDAS